LAPRLFGRRLKGEADAPVGDSQTLVRIEEAAAVGNSAKRTADRRLLRPRGRLRVGDGVRGRRRRTRGHSVLAALAAGRRAWVSVNGRGAKSLLPPRAAGGQSAG